MASARPRDFLPFKVFVQRAQVLSLYRQFFRATKPLGSAAADIRKCVNGPHDWCANRCRPVSCAPCREVRAQFRLYQSETDPKYVRTLIVQGSRQLDQIRAMVSTAAPLNPEKTAVEAPAVVDADHAALDTEPRMAEDREVGRGWPWQR